MLGKSPMLAMHSLPSLNTKIYIYIELLWNIQIYKRFHMTASCKQDVCFLFLCFVWSNDFRHFTNHFDMILPVYKLRSSPLAPILLDEVRTLPTEEPRCFIFVMASECTFLNRGTLPTETALPSLFK